MSRDLVRIAAAVACLAATGCTGFSLDIDTPRQVTVHFDTRPLEEDPGPALLRGVHAGGPFAHGPGGAELVYVVDGPSANAMALHGRKLPAGAMHELSDWPVSSALFALTPDGGGLYYPSYDPEGYRGVVLREAYSRKNVDLGGREPMDVVASADSAWLLVLSSSGSGHDPSEVVAVERATGALVLTPCTDSAGAVFSPAGDEVLCSRMNENWTFSSIRFGLGDQGTEVLPGVANCGGDFRTAWWGAGGILAACVHGEGGVVVGDPVTGAVVASTQVGGWFGGDVGPFSPDGSALAFFSGHCLAGERAPGGDLIVSCSREEWHVNLLDLASGAVTRLASSAGTPGTMAFSADGATLTYVLGDDIHYRSTGR